jgi:hypothetical protein
MLYRIRFPNNSNLSNKETQTFSKNHETQQITITIIVPNYQKQILRLLLRIQAIQITSVLKLSHLAIVVLVESPGLILIYKTIQSLLVAEVIVNFSKILGMRYLA